MSLDMRPSDIYQSTPPARWPAPSRATRTIPIRKEPPSAPRRACAVVGRLPPARTGDLDFAPEFVIVGWRDGWFLIRDARQGGYGAEPARIVFPGPGWIAAGRLSKTCLHRSGRAPSVR